MTLLAPSESFSVEIPAPPAPRTLADTGLSVVTIREIVAKTMFRMNIELVSRLSQVCCLPVNLVQDIIDIMRADRLVEAAGTLHATSGTSEMPYRLTDLGRDRALDALAQSEYFGPLPVPLDQFAAQSARQSIRNTKLSRDDLARAMGHLVLPPDLLTNLGPAVASGRSILMYGPPGNGKSSISNGIRDALGDMIYVPRALDYAGQVISVFDPIIHSPVPRPENEGLRRSAHRPDTRYVLCRRPTVVTGGELTLDMLDLKFNPAARTYTAPMQLKASGGIFIVDDLGRQAEPPQKLVNRWIVPLEEGRDILALQSGEKFTVPFDTLVIFSTNFHPNEIFDGAALRRIFFKIKIDGPGQRDYLKIFALVARKRGMALDEAAMRHLLFDLYPTVGNVYANYQPTYLIDQMIAMCDFEGLPRRMSVELMDRAWSNLFVRDEVIAK